MITTRTMFFLMFSNIRRRFSYWKLWMIISNFCFYFCVYCLELWFIYCDYVLKFVLFYIAVVDENVCVCMRYFARLCLFFTTLYFISFYNTPEFYRSMEITSGIFPFGASNFRLDFILFIKMFDKISMKDLRCTFSLHRVSREFEKEMTDR